MDYNTGQIIAEDNAYEQLNPASLTKMMTSYVIGTEIENGNISPTDEVTISKKSLVKKTSLTLLKCSSKWEKRLPVADLNRGIIVQSGNDACVAMAEHIAGTEDGFRSTYELMGGHNLA